MYEPTLPNQLTVLRMFLVPVLVVAMLSKWEHGDLLAAVIFSFASFTDALDGWIARRRDITSNFGKLVDPLADKLLVTAALISLVSLDRLAAWAALVIVAREFAVTGLRQLAMEQGGPVIPASIWGKLKTIMQVVMVLLLIAFSEPAWWVDVVVYATVAVTVLSGADYFFGLRHLLREQRAAGDAAGEATQAAPSNASAGEVPQGAPSNASAGGAPQAAPSSHSRIET
ncbi:MAG: CDP-diacylglycerol--glycerol-3-phosphate 3-phosphatidyltransferase [Actinomycetota bacterium]|nr:CDP-diacylglycerol--glycerol-3-phosphate 3-phosphatidyltransferase [Actinomycetota bacterium]